MGEIQSQIQSKIAEIAKLEKIKKHYEQANANLAQNDQQLAQLRKTMEKELKELDALQSSGLKPLFYKILGSKEKQIEKERQEYLEASLKYNELHKNVELLEYERDLLYKKLQNTTSLQDELKVLKAKRENEILKSEPHLAKKILFIAKKLDNLSLYKREIIEAKEQGEKCYNSINEMISELKKAKQWGNWDMVGGKGRMSDIYKHTAIDRAKNISIWTKHELVKFNKELQDIGQKGFSVNINMNSFTNFTDVFFDNLISDWVVQQKIVNSLSNTVTARDQLYRILKFLDEEVQNINLEVGNLEIEKNDILING